jgi:hypothetical protein
MPQPPRTTLAPLQRVILSIGLPILSALAFSFAGRPLLGLGFASLLLGVGWYRRDGLGIRGHRALYAGIGFASLAWLAFLVVRFVTVSVTGINGTFGYLLYLLVFEAFCTQLWAFGLVFRSVADWRGPLTAAVVGGLLFALAGVLFFAESTSLITGDAGAPLAGVLYFIVWGILYGIIRLRTGGILGTVIVQAMQSWTAWQLLLPANPPDPGQLRNLYLISSALYAVLIWRLWPRRESDFRV